MKKYGIEGCPTYKIFTEEGPAHAFIKKLGDVAVKPSGLTGGKGVKVMGDKLLTLKLPRLTRVCFLRKDLLLSKNA